MKSSEKKLLSIFLLLIFLLVNLLGFFYFSGQIEAFQSERENVEKAIDANREILEEYALWERRKEWLDTKCDPPRETQQGMKGKLLDIIKLEEEKQRLDIRESFLNLPNVGNYALEAVEVKVSGPEEQVYRFLFNLQDPEKLRGISDLSLRTRGKDTEKIECEAVIEQWYFQETSSITAHSEMVSK